MMSDEDLGSKSDNGSRQADPPLSDSELYERYEQSLKKSGTNQHGFETEKPTTARTIQLLSNISSRAAQPIPLTRRRKSVGRFTIKRELGRGTFGIVDLAEDSSLNRNVAIKVMRSELAERNDIVKRFEREAELAAQLEHPGIVPVYEIGQDEGIPYYVMAYCPGVNLAEWSSQQVLPIAPRIAAEIVRQLSEAVDYGHTQGVIHRDLKPANVMVTCQSESDSKAKWTANSQVRILDFGLACSVTETLRDTGSSMVLGTPLYMSPEQASGRSKDVGIATDIFSLGAILYELLTGNPPFEAASFPDVLTKLKDDSPENPRSINSAVDRSLQAICMKCLRRNPDDRFESAAELAEELQRYLSGESTKTRGVYWWDHLNDWSHHEQRIREAGTILIGVNALVFFWVHTTGVFNSEMTGMAANSPGEFFGLLVKIVLIVNSSQLLLMWLGYRIRRTKTLRVIQVALAFSTFQLAYHLCVIFGYFVPSQYYIDNPGIRGLLWGLTCWIVAFGEVALLLAYRAVKWRDRNDITEVKTDRSVVMYDDGLERKD